MIAICDKCGGLFITEPGESFAGNACSCIGGPTRGLMGYERGLTQPVQVFHCFECERLRAALTDAINSLKKWESGEG